MSVASLVGQLSKFLDQPGLRHIGGLSGYGSECEEPHRSVEEAYEEMEGQAAWALAAEGFDVARQDLRRSIDGAGNQSP
jgi:hypothetical protein